MTASLTTALLDLDDSYNVVLDEAARFVLDTKVCATARDRYAAFGFVTLEGVVPGGAMVSFAQRLLPFVLPIAEQVTMRQVAGADHMLSAGARFWRVDPHVQHDPAIREKLATLLDHLGFAAFGALLAERLTDVVARIAGPLRYHRAYFYFYKEGDYITAHDDHHVGPRVDVQFPLTLHSRGGVRVLQNGFLEMHYDKAGSMNLLGPSVWHEVPPLLRGTEDAEPLRINFGLRFKPLAPR